MPEIVPMQQADCNEWRNMDKRLWLMQSYSNSSVNSKIKFWTCSMLLWFQ